MQTGERMMFGLVKKTIPGRLTGVLRVITVRNSKAAMKKIAVLLSGGVDSSVALSLLKEQGYHVEAFYLKIWLEDELSYLSTCPWEEDLRYASGVCDLLNVPLHVISMQETYWQKVVAYTIEQVRAGQTPSPDILCNEFVKFGAFYDVIEADYDGVATGHYAQKEDINNISYLKCAKDPIKDQTYFLSRLSQSQLKRALFPIGHLLKSEVRDKAINLGLPTQTRKDSQGICFLGKFKFSDFIKHHIGTQRGDLVEFETGKIIGIHEGFWFYTIGQRKGIGLSGGPWFVAAKNPSKNIVYVSRNYYDDAKHRNLLIATDCRWISNQPPARECRVKIRHGEMFYTASIQKEEFLVGKNPTLHIQLDSNDQGIAPGQFAVFYQDDYCLGAGIITNEPEQGVTTHEPA